MTAPSHPIHHLALTPTPHPPTPARRDEGTPLEETLRTLDDFVRAGKIRYWGFSNTTGFQLQRIVETARRLGVGPCASLQQQYSALCRHTELEVAEVCINEGVALLAWSPLKGGWLTGKITRDGGAPEGSRVGWAQSTGAKMQSHPSFDALNRDAVWALLDGMAAAAAAHGVTVAQVALRWLLQKRATAGIVIGAKNVQQLRDNIACTKFTLTAEVRGPPRAAGWGVGGGGWGVAGCSSCTPLGSPRTSPPLSSRPAPRLSPYYSQEMEKLDALSFTANFGDALPYPYEMVTRINLPRKRPAGK